MIAYWDTSALLKLVYLEPGSDRAVEAQGQSDQVFSWDWMRVEAAAAVARRGGRSTRKHLTALLASVQWIRLNHEHYQSVVALCERHKLRSADAGHLFCLNKVAEIVGEIYLVCFDDELRRAARKDGMLLF